MELPPSPLSACHIAMLGLFGPELLGGRDSKVRMDDEEVSRGRRLLLSSSALHEVALGRRRHACARLRRTV
jgi:hypothetical protein